MIPRWGTALLDAVGKAINDTGQRLAAMPESERPGLVMMIIVTDGGENQSKEFTKKQIADMTKHQEDKYNWQFTYLGANQDAFAEAGGMGMSTGTSGYAAHKSHEAYTAASAKVRRGKAALLANALDTYDNEFTAEEVRSMT